MGRLRRTSKAHGTRNPKKLAMATKEHLATLPKPDLYSRPDISIKVLRSLARRKAYYRGVMRPIFYAREVQLSPLFQKENRDKYMNQVFTGICKIGQGCFGDVFRARSQDDSKMYAIKVTNDTHPFIDYGEVQRLEKVSDHENCVKFYMAWQECHRLYIQMELCSTSLDKVVTVYHHIDERHCWEIFIDVVHGLKHLHDKELIHLDIKPANIMVTSRGVCKIGDFGLLMDLHETDSEALRTRQGITVSEGDGKYVALEVLCEKTYSKAGDVFSLGLMMLEIASDVSLPTSGDDWWNIREGGLPTCYFDRPLTDHFRDLITDMTLMDYTKRPTVDDLLQNEHVVDVLQSRKKNGRSDYMGHWDIDSQEYMANHPESSLDIPAIQVEGPSPPRRPYPIDYVSPLSPVHKPAAQENETLASDTADGQPSTSLQYYETFTKNTKVHSIARRLFSP